MTSSAQGWGGVYIGVNAGYAFGSAKVATSTVFDNSGYFASSSVDEVNADGAGTLKPSGFTGGATVGWNIGHGSTLFGIEGDYSSMSSTQSRSVTNTYSCCDNSYTLDQTLKTDYLATARLRLGIAKPKTLLYLTGGAAMASMKFSEQFTDDFGPAAQSGEKTQTQTGWTAGAGVEQALGSGKWSVKLEYLYADLGTFTFQGGVLTDDGDPEPLNPFTNSVKLTTSVARLGLNFHF
jgi:outer membrane immunogenic protein